MFDCDDYLSSGSDDSLPPSPIYDRYHSGNGYHTVPPPYTGTFMPPKPDSVFNTIPNDVETGHPTFNVKLIPTKPDNDLSHTYRPSAPIIKDWVFDSEDESETKSPQDVPSFVQPNEQVKSPRHSVQHVETSIPTKTAIPKPISNGKYKNKKECFVQVNIVVPKFSVTRPRQANTVVTKSKSPTRRHVNRSLSPKFSNSPLRVTAVKAPMVNDAQGTCPIYLILRSSMIDMLPLEVIQRVNTNGDAAFDVKELEFEANNPESEVNVSPTSSAQSKKHDDKTKKEAKGKKLEDITYTDDDDDVGAEADFSNLETSITVSPILTTRVHKDHHVTQIIGDLSSATQTRSMTRVAKDQGGLYQINNKDFHTCDLPHGKKAIGTKWVFRNKKDERGIVVRNKARLVAQRHTQDEGINYEEVFALVARIEAIRLFLGYASFMGFLVYQMDVKSAFLYGTIEEEVYVYQPPGFEDPDHPDKVYKVVKALYRLHQAPGACHDKYVAEILRKFRLTDGKSTSTPIDIEKPLLKDPDGEDVDVHTYKSMIGLLMYLTSSRPDIMFAVCACACFQVKPKASHLHAVKRILRYLKGKPHLGLWYPKDSTFDLVAYSDSDYAGASLDRKSTTRGCQFLGCKLISWQCKKQTVVATSSTEAEYVAPTSCCAQVVLSSIESLKRMVHVINILSVGSLTTPQMVLNSPCLTHIKNWLVHIKWSLFWTTVAVKMVNNVTRLQALVNKKNEVVTEASIRDALCLDDAEVQEVRDEGADEVPVGDVNVKGAAEGIVSAADDVVPTADEEPSISSLTPPTPSPQPSQDIPSTSQRVKKLERRNKDKVLKLRRLQKVRTPQRIDTSDDIVMDDVSNQGRMNMDQYIKVVLEEDKYVDTDIVKDAQDAESAHDQGRQVESQAEIYKINMRHAQKVPAATLTAAPSRVTAAPSKRRKRVVIKDPEESSLSIIIPAETKSKDKVIDHVNKKAKEDPAVKKYQALKRKPQTEAQARKNMIVYLKNTKEKIKEEESRALKRLNETLAEKAAKKKKLDEEVEELKRHLQIVSNEEDDVYIETTPLALKVPVVDYEIYNEHSKPYYKIKRADSSHQLYLSFISMLKNFNREDLEVLWRLVKERFATTKPKNFSDDFLMITLGAMFEKPDIHAQIWKNQRSLHGQAKVKSWKLLESCGVQIITFTTTQLILLVDRKYPLTKFTLNQMINNVRIKVEEESEVSLELLSFGVDAAMDLKKNMLSV
nr:hypothetical protein [Tanacetum cinerariifolium]